MSTVNRGTIDTAVRDMAQGKHESMRVLLNAMREQMIVPGQPPLLEPTSGGKSNKPVNAPPPAHALTVTGANGAHNISIAAPSQALQPTVYHELSNSETANFSNPTTFPLTTSTTLSIPNPGSNLHWRIRSSYDQVRFNAYAPAQGGNPLVSAGLQSSDATAPAVVLNQTNLAVVDSVPDGSSANVRVYGPAGPGTMWIGIKGGKETVYPSATIINQPVGKSPYVAFDGEQFMAKSTLPQVFSDENIPVGQVGIPSGGSITLPTVVAVVSGGAVVGYNVTAGGANIAADLTLVVSGNGAGATTGAQVISGGALQSVAAGNVGTGYTAATVTPSGGAAPGTTGGGGIEGNNPGRFIPNLNP